MNEFSSALEVEVRAFFGVLGGGDLGSTQSSTKVIGHIVSMEGQ